MSALGKKCTGCGNLVKEVSISKVYVNDFYYNRQSGEVHYALITEFSCPHCGLDLELTSQDLFIDLDPTRKPAIKIVPSSSVHSMFNRKLLRVTGPTISAINFFIFSTFFCNPGSPLFWKMLFYFFREIAFIQF